MSLLSRNHKETPALSGTMRAVARQREKYTHDIKMGDHRLVADEPTEQGGLDEGPNPQELLAASLAWCTAIRMEMYAKRKGWDVAGLEVDCRYNPGDRGCLTKFDRVMRMPPPVSE